MARLHPARDRFEARKMLKRGVCPYTGQPIGSKAAHLKKIPSTSEQNRILDEWRVGT